MESSKYQSQENKRLKFIKFFQLSNWSSYTLLSSILIYTKKYNFSKIGNFLNRNKTQVIVEDSISYKRASIRINGLGITLRDEVLGKNIGTKKQFRIKRGQFLLSKIDARNGAFGVVPIELDNGIITGNFWTFDVDYNIIDPYYLSLLTKTKRFQKLCQTASVGTTNRNYLQEILFLNFEIPLPSLTEQRRILLAYKDKMNIASLLEKEVSNVEFEIENYFLKQLGLEQFSIKHKLRTLQSTNYSILDRWDIFSADTRILIELRKSKFELSSIGMSYHFIKRTWNKSKYDKDTFKYIEIGAIDPTNGIIEAKELEIKKAPSRATQLVKEGDLIIGTTRPYLKKFAIVTKTYDSNVCSSGFCVIKQSREYHLPYLHQFLKCAYGIEQLKNKMTGGLYPAITENELKKIKIPLPAVEEQIKIMTLINQKKNDIISNKQRINDIKVEAEIEFEKEVYGK
jgi:type I restriction enzyme, S subunit